MSTVQSIIDAQPTIVIVSEYEVDRCYGGPEEGGWWFYRSHFVRLVTPRNVDRATAFAIARRKNKAQRDYLDSLSFYERRAEDKITFCVERKPRYKDNSKDPRPHYC